MSSIQERLQLKRVPLDTWNIREQLCLASAVVRSGDQNWMSVSRALKAVGEPNRPTDWYSQKSCAAQYGALLEHVETPKRKKRCPEASTAVETPQESIVKKLAQERIVEIQKTIAEMNQQYDSLKNEITEVRNPSTSETRLREIWTGIESAMRAREREHARRAASLREREERRARAERTWRPQSTPTSPVTPTTPSSPLLTSLLKSSPVVTTPQHIPHPAGVVDTMSPSVTAPTLSMLLEKGSPQHESKHAAIEHIKSQLVQIEQQLKANASPPAPPVPAVDIDDIEIKAEDVYVFRDVDLPLPSQKLVPPRPVEQLPPKEEEIPIEVETVDPTDEIKEEHITVQQIDQEETVDVESETIEETVVEEPEQEEVPEVTADVTVDFPEVKFPTTEIKVIQPDDVKIKEEESKEPEVTPETSQPETEVEEEIVVQEEETVDVVEEGISEDATPPQPSPQPVNQAVVQSVDQPVEEPVEEPVDEPVEKPVEELVQETQQIVETERASSDPQDIPLPPEPALEDTVPEAPIQEPEVTPPLPEPETQPEQQPEVKEDVEEAETATVDVTTVETTDDLKKDDDSEDSIPLKQMIQESLRSEAAPLEETHTETDDDTPMEVSREEEKDGKKRRDYSRKKKADSRACSGSESAPEAEVGAPESPLATDAERQRRLWKKSVMLVYSRLCAHKYASLFLRPISDEEAPGYSACVRRPMDLTTIRRNIDSGHIRNTGEFQRDVLLMLSNALLYNSSEHSVYAMAREMQEEAQSQLGILLAAQAHAGLEAPPRRKRRRHDEPKPTPKRNN